MLTNLYRFWWNLFSDAQLISSWNFQMLSWSEGGWLGSRWCARRGCRGASCHQPWCPQRGLVERSFPQTSLVERSYPQTSSVERSFPQTCLVKRSFPLCASSQRLQDPSCLEKVAGWEQEGGDNLVLRLHWICSSSSCRPPLQSSRVSTTVRR